VRGKGDNNLPAVHKSRSAKTNTGDIDIGEREYNAGTIRVGSGDKTITAHTNTGDIDIEND
jgi:hypothetical protein